MAFGTKMQLMAARSACQEQKRPCCTIKILVVTLIMGLNF